MMELRFALNDGARNSLLNPVGRALVLDRRKSDLKDG
jgi:hypothetical protein